MGIGPATDREAKARWDKFWRRDREIGRVYSNDGRVCENLARVTDVRGARVLEVGGGSGRDSLEMIGGGAEGIVLDYTLAPLELVRAQAEGAPRAPLLVCGDALALPFRDGTFDVVFHQGLMEHFRDPTGLLSENRRVLRTGGHLLVDVPQRWHAYTLVKIVLIRLNRWFAGWETQYSIRELESIVRGQGIDPVLSYGDWMAPSFAYRLLREAFLAAGIELPLYPRAPLPRLRDWRRALKRRLRRTRAAFYSFHVIGVIGRKGDA